MRPETLQEQRLTEGNPSQKKAAATIRDARFETEEAFWEFFMQSESRGGVMDH
mgnify:CR=1 FL=1